MLQQICVAERNAGLLYDATDALAVAMCHHYQIHAPVHKSGTLKGMG